MVLADLGARLNGALAQLTRASVVDDRVIDSLLKELCAALLEADVNVKLVSQLRTKIKTKVGELILSECPLTRQVKKNLEEAEKAGGKEANKKNVVQKVSYHLATAQLTRRQSSMSWSRLWIRERNLTSPQRGK